MVCSFCAKKGHKKAFCPSVPSRPPKGKRCEWGDKLIFSTPRVDPSIYSGMSLAGAMALFLDLGEKFNLGNPTLRPTVGTDFRNALRSKLGFWKALGADKTVLSYVYYGLPHRQYKRAPRGTYANKPSAHKHAEFVTNWLKSQVEAGRAMEVEADFPELVMGLLVEEQIKSSGSTKLRPCVCMIPANATLADVSFTLETLSRHGKDVISPGDALITIDLSDAYLYTYMEPEAIPFLCIFWEEKFYALLCLMFGHRLGPLYFTKIVRPILGFFRTLLLRVLGYLDGPHTTLQAHARRT